MGWNIYSKVIDEIAIKNPGARVWEIFFGDPFLCKDMAQRIEYAKTRGLTDVVLNSNGSRMTSDRARSVIEAGLDAMYVGVDAARKETYEKIRVGAEFEVTVKNVLAYRDLLTRYGRPDQKLFVQFVVSDINEKEMEDFRLFWNREGVSVKFRPRISWGGLIEAPNLVRNSDVQRKPCYWLMQTMSICADGEVPLCAVDLHCQVKCGNARERSLEELWRHGRLKEFRDMHLEGRYDELPELCRECSDWQSAYSEYHEVRVIETESQ